MESSVECWFHIGSFRGRGTHQSPYYLTHSAEGWSSLWTLPTSPIPSSLGLLGWPWLWAHSGWSEVCCWGRGNFLIHTMSQIIETGNLKNNFSTLPASSLPLIKWSHQRSERSGQMGQRPQWRLSRLFWETDIVLNRTRPVRQLMCVKQLCALADLVPTKTTCKRLQIGNIMVT